MPVRCRPRFPSRNRRFPDRCRSPDCASTAFRCRCLLLRQKLFVLPCRRLRNNYILCPTGTPTFAAARRQRRDLIIATRPAHPILPSLLSAAAAQEVQAIPRTDNVTRCTSCASTHRQIRTCPPRAKGSLNRRFEWFSLVTFFLQKKKVTRAEARNSPSRARRRNTCSPPGRRPPARALSLSPTAPFLPTAEEMGERTPAETAFLHFLSALCLFAAARAFPHVTGVFLIVVGPPTVPAQLSAAAAACCGRNLSSTELQPSNISYPVPNGHTYLCRRKAPKARFDNRQPGRSKYPYRGWASGRGSLRAGERRHSPFDRQ